MLTFMVFSRLSSLGCHVTSPCQLDTTHTADSSQAAAGRTWCMSGVFRIQGVLFSPASSDSSGVCAAAEDPPWNAIYTLFIFFSCLWRVTPDRCQILLENPPKTYFECMCLLNANLQRNTGRGKFTRLFWFVKDTSMTLVKVASIGNEWLPRGTQYRG